MTKVAITGAGGQLGRRAAELALERAEPANLILVTRTPDTLADLAARGAEVRRGDFDEPASLEAAFAGVERLLLVSTDALDRRAEQQRAAIDAAKAAGLKHVIYTSVPNPVEAHPTGLLGESHRQTEEALRASGLDWTLLRNSLYADMQVPAAAQAAASGRLFSNAGEGRIAHVTREDCAAVAAAVLTSDGHAGAILDVTGPELLTDGERAALFAELSGRPVQLVQLDDAAYAEGLVAAGVPEPMARVLAGFGIAQRDGLLDVRTSVVEDLTGRPATSLRQLLEASREALAAA